MEVKETHRLSQQHDRQYLIKENRRLRMELKEANDLKILHQKALMNLKQQSLAENKQKSPSTQVISTLIEIVNKSSSEAKLHRLNEYIMNLEGKIMVLEKIVSQTEQNQKETYNLLADDFQRLKEQNQKKDDQLHKFYEKIGEVDYLSGLVTKYKEIISTTQQSMAFKKEQQQLLDALNLQQQTIKRLTEEKEKLLKINVHMKQEVQKRKDQVRNMTMMLFQEPTQSHEPFNTQNILGDLQNEGTGSNQQIESGFSNGSRNANISVMSKSNMSMNRMNMSGYNNANTTLNFIKLQRQLIKQANQEQQMDSSFTNQSELDCPQLSILFPDKVQQIRKKKTESKVPYLNMKKVREMMAERQQKMRKQWEKQKHHINPTTKIIQLETQLGITRKELSSQTLKFRIISDQLKQLRLQREQLQKRNQLLLESNQKLKTNYQLIYKDYQLCKSITAQIQRLIGKPINDQNQKHVKRKLGELVVEQQQNDLESLGLASFRQSVVQTNQKPELNRLLQQIFKFKEKNNRKRCYSI